MNLKNIFYAFLAVCLNTLTSLSYSDSLSVLTNLNRDNAQLSQTELHMKHNSGRINPRYDDYLNDPILINMVKQVIAYEKEFAQKGYYTFVHGQRSEYLLPELWHTWLWEIKHQKNADQFIFAHVKNQLNALQKLLYEPYCSTLIRQGTAPVFGTPNIIDCLFFCYRNPYLLYMNYAFFGNAGNHGEDTAAYIQANKNVNKHIRLTIKDVFVMHDYSDIYEQYKRYFDTLEQEYEKLCNYGNALFIAIPPDKINKYVYVAKPWGIKRKVYFKTGLETSDMKLIMDTLRTNPEEIIDYNSLIFCLTMTSDVGLNPNSGIKIIPIASTSPQAWLAFDTKQKALLRVIQAVIEGQIINIENIDTLFLSHTIH